MLLKVPNCKRASIRNPKLHCSRNFALEVRLTTAALVIEYAELDSAAESLLQQYSYLAMPTSKQCLATIDQKVFSQAIKMDKKGEQ